jgi:hypothetical protein
MRTQFLNSLLELSLYGLFLFKNYFWDFKLEYTDLCTGVSVVKVPCGIYYSRIPRENNLLFSATLIISTIIISAKKYYDFMVV